ncbi:MAG: hypothetical protein RUMPE_00639 [Eubacteriales bacterium SKADARSKE-1]|nr:hypothetical protein [Eubacteriales bacterium SKADARSKE-1]
MNKIQMISLLENLDLPEDDYYILSGGCLLLYGIREEAQDLDLCVSSKLFNQLKKEYNIDEKSKNPVGFYKLMDDVEIVVQPKKIFKENIKMVIPLKSWKLY